MITRSEFVKRWSQALEARGASVFVGAGLSRAAGYPDWKTLLQDVALGLGLDIADEHDLAGVAQYSVNRSAGSRNKLKQAIIDNFPPKADTPDAFKILARLPLRHVWTTNYDTLIETAWSLERKQIDVKSRNADLGHEMPWAHTILYKMHGTINHPSEVVIAKDDYELYRRERPSFLQLLTGHLVSMEMLFLGFSFTDPNLAHLFASIRETFRGDGPRHYAIVRRPQRGKGPNAVRQFKTDKVRHALWIEDLQRYGIECVEIDSYDEVSAILREVEMHLSRNSVFLSGSFLVTPPHDLAEEKKFIESVAHGVGQQIASRQKRLVSGYGLVVGSAAITGALEIVLAEKTPNLDRSLLLRPFPRDIPDGIDKRTFHRLYREAMVRQAGVCIFIAGYKEVSGKLQIGTGTIEEFKCALEVGRVCIPIGATGYAAAEIWRFMNEDKNSTSRIPGNLFDKLIEKTSANQLVETVGAILDHLDQKR